MTKKAYTPTGVEIIGTNERIPGTAYAAVTFDEKGRVDVYYEGETQVDWDGQETVALAGVREFVDENGATWAEWELVAIYREILRRIPS